MTNGRLPEEPFSCQQNIPSYGEKHAAWFRRALPPTSPRARDNPNYGRQILSKGHLRRPGAKPLNCDILFEPDIPVTMRDGTVILADVLRPVGDGACPAIVSWSPFGKSIGGVRLDDFHHRVGVPLDATTELMKWEAADPGFWVNEGYAVLHPDARGSFRSGGDIHFWGRQEAEDGHDFIEWAAAQPWSNGKVGMAGNSWLAVIQWFVAAEQPPHLAAIAPWEGLSDVMRELAMRGGIPNISFPESIIQSLAGERLIEDLTRMATTERDFTQYWQDKRARFDRIEVPSYVVACWDNFIHTQGTLAAWRDIASSDKWLRIHNTHEWPDFYDPAYTQDLLRFFDHYLKGADNGWESTPRIRATLLDGGGPPDEVGRVIESFPPKDAAHSTLYLGDGGVLSPELQAMPAQVNYPVSQIPGAVFRMQVPHEAEILGYCKAKLWVEAEGADDMDLAVLLEKRTIDGGPAARYNPHGDPAPFQALGLLRVSRRELDPELSCPAEPILKLVGERRLQPGEIVPVEIGIWPLGLKVHAGEWLQLTIIPFFTRPPPFPLGSAKFEIPADSYVFDPASPPAMVETGGAMAMDPAWVSEQAIKPDDRNRGVHRIHFGGAFDSHLFVPLVPVLS